MYLLHSRLYIATARQPIQHSAARPKGRAYAVDRRRPSHCSRAFVGRGVGAAVVGRVQEVRAGLEAARRRERHCGANKAEAVPPVTLGRGLAPPLPHLHPDWDHASHICARTGLTAAASVPGPGLSSSLAATSAPGLGSPPTSAHGLGSPLSHLHRDWARSSAHVCAGTGLTPCHICIGTGRGRELLACIGGPCYVGAGQPRAVRRNCA